MRGARVPLVVRPTNGRQLLGSVFFKSLPRLFFYWAMIPARFHGWIGSDAGNGVADTTSPLAIRVMVGGHFVFAPIPVTRLWRRTIRQRDCQATSYPRWRMLACCCRSLWTWKSFISVVEACRRLTFTLLVYTRTASIVPIYL